MEVGERGGERGNSAYPTCWVEDRRGKRRRRWGRSIVAPVAVVASMLCRHWMSFGLGIKVNRGVGK